MTLEMLKKFHSYFPRFLAFASSFFFFFSSWVALLQMCKHQLGLDIFFHENSVSILKNIMYSGNEAVKFRVLALTAGIASASVAACRLCEQHGFLKETVSLIDGSDILERLNAIELLDQVMFVADVVAV